MLCQVPFSQLPASRSQPHGPSHLPTLQRKAEKQSSALVQWQLPQMAKPFLDLWQQEDLIKLHRSFSSLPLNASFRVSLLKSPLLLAYLQFPKQIIRPSLQLWP